MSKGIAARKYGVVLAAVWTWGSLCGAQDPFQFSQGNPFASMGFGQPGMMPSMPPALPASPVPPMQQPTPILAGHDEDHSANTSEEVNLSDEERGESGNWLKKKEWVKQGRELEAAIQELIVEAQATKVSLYESTGSSVAKDLDQFQQEVGMGYGEIEGIVTEVSAYLDKRLQKARNEKDTEPIVKPTGEVVAPLSVYELQDQVDARKLELEQLKLDMTYVADLDKALSERVKKADEMIAYVMKHSQDADLCLNKMWYIIDHTKARQKYYEMNDHYEKIKAAVAYIKGELSQNFEQVVSEIKNQIRKCSENVKKLEDKDLIIKSRKQRLDDIRAKQKEAEDIQTQSQEKAKKGRKDIKLNQSWMSFEGFYDAITTPLSNFWDWLLGLFGAKSATLQVVPKKAKQAAKPQEIASPAPVK